MVDDEEPIEPEDEFPESSAPIEEVRDLEKIEAAYTGDQIQVLEGLEAVRQRPAMYIGGTDSKGLHHLFSEVVDNSIDEAMAGHCNRIEVTLHEDGSLSVRDNGRGIPVDINQQTGLPGVELALTRLHAGGKFGGGSYKVSGGLHGVGVSCVNAVSEWLTVDVWRDGRQYRIGFQRGVTTEPLHVIGTCPPEQTGTLVRWQPDLQIFPHRDYDPERIMRRMRELAYLNKDVTLTFTNLRDEDGENAEFHFERGLAEFVEHLNENRDVLHRAIAFGGTRDDIIVEAALQYAIGIQESILSFANMINTPDGGTHLSGLRTALTRVLNAYARKQNLLKEKDNNFTGDDVREGLAAVVSVKLTNPQFESQTKVKLTNALVEGVTHSIIGEKLAEFLEENPAVAKRIIDRVVIARTAREAARKAAETVRRQSALDTSPLTGKLADCIEKDPTKCELFVVEGDSAGGSAKQGRDRRTQAILPLRGKIINVGKARIDKVLDNTEIRSMITALGTGISFGDDTEEDENDNGPKRRGYDLSKLRYHKIILMTDADVDGDHIRTLLLTFFWQYMRPLIEEGYVYIAQPPLYRIRVGKDTQHYAKTEEDRDEILKSLRNKKDVHVTRFKGLGEMDPVDLEDTTMKTENRRLARVTIEQALAAEELFSILMSDKVEPRRDFIVKHAKEVSDVDWHG